MDARVRMFIFCVVDRCGAFRCDVQKGKKKDGDAAGAGSEVEAASTEELNSKINTLEKEKNKEEEYRNYMQLERVRAALGLRTTKNRYTATVQQFNSSTGRRIHQTLFLWFRWYRWSCFARVKFCMRASLIPQALGDAGYALRATTASNTLPCWENR